MKKDAGNRPSSGCKGCPCFKRCFPGAYAAHVKALKAKKRKAPLTIDPGF